MQEPSGVPPSKERYSWLLTASLLLAVLLEVLPAEAGTVYFSIRNREVLNFALAKGGFLLAIPTPLAIYYLLNGRSLAKLAKHRPMMAVLTIIALNALMNLMAWVRM